jgi:hypothetical protein
MVRHTCMVRHLNGTTLAWYDTWMVWHTCPAWWHGTTHLHGTTLAWYDTLALRDGNVQGRGGSESYNMKAIPFYVFLCRDFGLERPQCWQCTKARLINPCIAKHKKKQSFHSQFKLTTTIACTKAWQVALEHAEMQSSRECVGLARTIYIWYLQKKHIITINICMCMCVVYTVLSQLVDLHTPLLCIPSLWRPPQEE